MLGQESLSQEIFTRTLLLGNKPVLSRERGLVLTKRPTLALLLILLMSISAAEVTSASDAPTWSKRYSGAYFDKAYSAIQSNDGGFVVAGYAGSRVDDHAPLEHKDEWGRLHVAKFDAYGQLLWNRFYSEDDDNRAYSIIQTSDGGYAIAGEKHSPITKIGSNGYDFWLIKTDSFGNMQWEKTYDEQGAHNGARSIIQTDDGGYALAGTSTMYDNYDFWLVKTDPSGNMLWNRTYGEKIGNTEIAYSMVQTSDGGYFLAGVTDSPTESYESHFEDFLLVKTDASGFAPEISGTIHFSVAKAPELSLLTTGAVAFVIVVIIIVGLRVYFKKPKH